MKYNIIITGTTGMVGEGVLLKCLEDERVASILSVSRKSNKIKHPKLREYIVPDFLAIKETDEMFKGFDACFFCAGVSSIGMNEADYTRNTYDTTMQFAKVVLNNNPEAFFIYVSGASTSQKSRMMWARVKGKTENDLARLAFKKMFSFRPGFMRLTKGQKYPVKFYKYFGWMFPILKLIIPNNVSTVKQVGQAMINSLRLASDRHIMEVKEINKLGSEAA